MFTLRFESDTRTSNSGDIVYMIATKDFRAEKHQDGAVVVFVGDCSQIVDGGLGNYDRCFVMNESGATVATFRPAKNASTGETLAA